MSEVYTQNRPFLVVILDGWGSAPDSECNAISRAQPKTFLKLWNNYPHAELHASGAYVGLPDGWVGNSEVGHYTIGAGKIVKQSITQLQTALATGELFTNNALTSSLSACARSKKTVHCIGLLSDAGVHSHINNLYAYIRAAHEAGVSKILVHAILDGRDTDPHSAKQYLTQLEDVLLRYPNAHIGSIHGRWYAMDRDGHVERTCKTVHVLLQSTAPTPWRIALEQGYQNGLTDEYIVPTSCIDHSIINPDDGVLLYNTRPDRIRQLVQALTNSNKIFCNIKAPRLAWIISPVSYGPDSPTIALYDTPRTTVTLRSILAREKIPVLMIAETEKTAHVTYFIGCGRTQPYSTEHIFTVPSLPVRSYAEAPHMSAAQITDTVLESMKNHAATVYIINYANADMVGHTGDFEATKKAILSVDFELERLYTALQTTGGSMLIIGDHGNAEKMCDAITKKPWPGHTVNPVPALFVSHKKKHTLTMHSLADVAPFILTELGISFPE